MGSRGSGLAWPPLLAGGGCRGPGGGQQLPLTPHILFCPPSVVKIETLTTPYQRQHATAPRTAVENTILLLLLLFSGESNSLLYIRFLPVGECVLRICDAQAPAGASISRRGVYLTRFGQREVPNGRTTATVGLRRG